MKVLSKSSVSFSSMRYRKFDRAGNVINCNYTNFNRADIDWKKFAEFLGNRYKDAQRVQIHSFGCSDGSDVYTLIINLINNLGEQAKKFFPIFASDFAPEMIEMAKSRKILLHSRDIEFLKEQSAYGFFEEDKTEAPQIMSGIEFYPHKVKEGLFSKVNFSIKDIIKSSRIENFSNKVVMFRNGWTFNSLKKQNEIANNLYTKSNDKTLVVIGQSDLFKSAASDYLQGRGLNQIFLPAQRPIILQNPLVSLTLR